MRFVADGVNLPDDLLWAHDEGRVVFFCGAGVSQAKAHLPDFNGLTKRVLDELGATEDDGARKLYESLSGIDGIAISDQVFQRLRRTFTEKDIGEKVAACLRASDDVDLTAHRTLLSLAKLQSGETRIVTTNFDRLFERCSPRLPSVTRSSLPHLQFNEADWGIVHLHGCVLPDYSGPTSDGFVLSSAEFGDAYLALGWARDFVKQILERYVAVFVGYSADDPPIRYLLEGLQQSRTSNNKAYAFQSSLNEQAVVAWREKGVEALRYEISEGDGHRALWDTLEAWGKRARDPTTWRKRVLDRARKGPSALAPYERGMVAHIVSSASGAQALARHTPPISAEWLCVFDPLVRYGEPGAISGRYSNGPVVDPFDRYRLDGDPLPRAKADDNRSATRVPENVWAAFDATPTDYKELGPTQLAWVRGFFASRVPRLARRLDALATWVASVASEPAAAWWAGQQSSLHHEVLDRVRIDREQKVSSHVHEVVAEAWRTIIEYHDLRAAERDGAHETRLKARKSGWHGPLAREYAENFAPKLKLNPWWRAPVPPPPSRKLRRNDLVHVEVEYSEAVRTIPVPDDFLAPLMSKLRAALELAEDLEKRYAGYLEIASIEPDESDGDDDDANYSRQYKLSGHVIHFVGLFKRLAKLDPEAARAELAAWPQDSYVFGRVRVWALGNLDIASADAFADTLLSLPDKNFWPFRGERDLLLGLARRWAEFDKDSRKRIERRIRKGPPDSKGPGGAKRSAHWRLSRLNWLKSKRCDFSFDLAVENAKLQAIAPEWKVEYAAHAADTHDGKSGWVKTETDFSTVEGLPANEIIPHIQKMERRPDEGFVSYEPFLGLSQQRPQLALNALEASLADGLFDAGFWQTFLRGDVRKSDEPSFSILVARALVALPTDNLAALTHAAASWFEATGKAILAERPDVFDEVWCKLLDALGVESQANKSTLVRQGGAVDWATEAINSPAGDLAQLAMLIAPDQPGKSGFSKNWLGRIEQLLNLPGDSRRYALVILGFQLVWIFAHDEQWASDHILAVLDNPSAGKADAEAIWAGIFWRSHTPQTALYGRLKPHMIGIVREQSELRGRHEEVLAGYILAGWAPDEKGDRLISSDEMRALLLDADDDFRRHVVYTLDRWSENSDRWGAYLAEFLREAWPKQKGIRTPEISARLCDLALSQKKNFPEIANLVAGLVAKVGDSRLFIPELRKSEETIAGQHPVEMLGLLYAVLPDNRLHWPWGADTALKALAETMPGIRGDPRFIELESKLN